MKRGTVPPFIQHAVAVPVVDRRRTVANPPAAALTSGGTVPAMRVVVAPLGNFPDGERRIVDVGGRSIGVFRVGESFYGIRNRCPHQGGPLCLGHVLGVAVADAPGKAFISSDPLRIACPWHGWEYDLDTGQSFMGGAMAGVRSYGAGVHPGASLLESAVASPARRVPGPYVAETFEVKVEDEYVVLEA
jgi:nitrite reductase/ring-hydroxylating ferredoxin subunit